MKRRQKYGTRKYMLIVSSVVKNVSWKQTKEINNV